MTTPAADYLVDRRRMRRQLGRWRILAYAAIAVAILAVGYRAAAARHGAFEPAHIARITLTGLITGDAATVKLIHDVAESKSAAAALLTIDSPGGTTAGSEVIYEEVRRLSSKKPVVAVVGTLAASGAYIAALGADRIVVRQNSIVGSIGVLVEYPNVSGLLDRIGVKVEAIKSSPLKAAPNGLEPTSEEARAAMAALIADSYAWFKDLVKSRRAMTDDELAKVVDGRVYTGRQSLPLKLADAIGGERDAIAWLEKEKGVAKDLPVRDWRPESGLASRLGLASAAASLAEALNFSGTAAAFRRIAAAESEMALDGLVSIWKVNSGD